MNHFYSRYSLCAVYNYLQRVSLMIWRWNWCRCSLNSRGRFKGRRSRFEHTSIARWWGRNAQRYWYDFKLRYWVAVIVLRGLLIIRFINCDWASGEWDHWSYLVVMYMSCRRLQRFLVAKVDVRQLKASIKSIIGQYRHVSVGVAIKPN